MSEEVGQRITLKRSRPNPLFQEWLEELHEEAKSKKSKLEPMLKEALDSLLKYPLPLKSGAECMVLKGFKEKLCVHLDQRLEVYRHNLRLTQSCKTNSVDSISSNGRSTCSSPLSDINDNISVRSGPSHITTTIKNVGSNSEVSYCKATSKSQDAAVSSTITNSEIPSTSSKGSEKPSKRKKYKPAYKSGAYAILITLLEESIERPDEFLTKEELINKAQKHSKESFNRPKPETFYTAWSSMSNLLKKELVKTVKNKKVKYQLTEEGLELAKELLEEYENTPTLNDILFNEAPSSSHDNIERNNELMNEPTPPVSENINEAVIKLPPYSYDIILLIDKNETSGMDPSILEDLRKVIRDAVSGHRHLDDDVALLVFDPTTSDNGADSWCLNIEELSKDLGWSSIKTVAMCTEQSDWPNVFWKNIEDLTSSRLSKKNDPVVVQFQKLPGLLHEYRSLKVGDFTWIARHKVNKDQELVIPYIVERKRMDDLGASIKDGRFHEQKFRLKKCGLKHVIYLVEHYGKDQHVGLPIQHLMQAIANTRVQDGFKVQITDSLTNSITFLAILTRIIETEYKGRSVEGLAARKEGYLMTFDYFNKASSKSKPLTVTETFIKLLLQLKGVSVEKALAITAKYKTPKSLIVAYLKCDQSEGESLLANLKYNEAGRNVGPAVSKAIYQLFSSPGG